MYSYKDLVDILTNFGEGRYIDEELSNLEYNSVEVPKEKVDAVCYGLADRLTCVSTFNTI